MRTPESKDSDIVAEWLTSLSCSVCLLT